MSEQLFLFIGAERFLAWTVLFMIGYLYGHLAKKMRGTEFYIPALGIQVEAYGWATHQFVWFIHHMMRISPTIHEQDTVWIAMVASGLAYLACAVGGAMVLEPFLRRTYKDSWWKVATVWMGGIFVTGYAMGLIWMVA